MTLINIHESYHQVYHAIHLFPLSVRTLSLDCLDMWFMIIIAIVLTEEGEPDIMDRSPRHSHIGTILISSGSFLD